MTAPLLDQRPWGRELVFAATESYAGKILHIRAGHRLSLQHHEHKDESILVLSGELDVLTFASPSAVDNFFALLDEPAKAAACKLVIAAVGKTTSLALERVGAAAAVVPDRPGGVELVAALAAHMAQTQGLGD